VAYSTVVTITVDPASVGGTATDSQTICNNTSPANLTLTGNTGSVIRWEKATDAVFTTPVTIAVAATTLPGATIGNLTATTYFRAVVQSGVCTSVNSTTVQVTVTPNAAVTSINGTSPLCPGGTATFTANGVVTGGGIIDWNSSNPLVALVDAGGLVTALAAGTCNITYTISGGCGTASAQFALTVNPTPEVSNVFPTMVCTGSLFNFTAISSIAGSTYSWSRPAVAGVSNASSLNNLTAIINETLNLNIPSGSPVNVIYSFTLTAGECSHSEAFTVTVVPKPGVTVSANPPSVCPGSPNSSPFDLISSSDIDPPPPNAQLWFENFESPNIGDTTGPAGWINHIVTTATGTSLPGNLTRWTIQSSLPSGYNTTGEPTLPDPWVPVTIFSNTNDKFYVADNTPGRGNVTATLVTPAFNATAYTTIILDFWHYYRDKNHNNNPAIPDYDFAYIDVSTDGGLTWPPALTKRYDDTQGLPYDFTHETINLGFLNSTNVKVRFRFTPTSDFYWAIDNVRVTGTFAVPYFDGWTATSGYTSLVANQPGVTQTATTTYTATYKDLSASCTGTASVTVPNLPTPVVPLISPRPGPINVCSASTITFNTIPGTEVSRRWNLNGSPAGFPIPETGTTYTTEALTKVTPGIGSTNVTLTIKNSDGCYANSAPTSIYITPAIATNTISAPQVICSGSAPLILMGSTPTIVNGVPTGTAYTSPVPVYSWEFSTTSAVAGFAVIAPSNTKDYQPPELGVTTWYRRKVSSAAINPVCWDYSAAIEITVNSLTAGIVAGDQTICNAGDPLAFTITTAATGPPTAILSYQWQSSATDCTNGFSNINLATNPTYDVPAGLIVTTYYRRVVTSTLNSVACTATSNCITITINSVTAGVVSSGPAICAGGDPAAFTVTTAASGSGVLTYQWQSNTTGCGGIFANIGGAGTTNATYDPPAGLTLTTYYQREVTSTLSGVACPANSNCITVTVNPLPTTSAIYHQ
jgi:hypothetical protein